MKKSEAKALQQEYHKVLIKINRNQDPDLYAMLENAESWSGTARQLMRLGFKALTEVPGDNTEKEV